MKLLRVLLLWLGLAVPAAAQVASDKLPPVPDSLRTLLRPQATPASRQAALQRVADAYAQLADSARAMPYARAAEALARQRQDRVALGNALATQANVYSMVGQLNRALKLGQEALALHVGQPGWAQRQRLLGLVYTRLGRPAEALAALRAGAKAFAARQDRINQYNIDNNIGLIFFNGGQLDSADFYLMRAVRGLHQLPHTQREEASALGNLAMLNNQRRQYALASRYARQSLALQLAVGDSTGLGATLSTLHNIASAADSLPQALRYARQGLRLARRYRRRNSEIVALNNLGTTYRRLQQPDSAEACYLQALAITYRGGEPVRRGSTLHLLASLYDLNNRPADALRRAQEVDALDSVYRLPSITLSNLKLLARLAETQNDHTAALGYLKRLRALEQRQATAQSSKDIAALRVQFDTERAEQQVRLLAARNQAQARQAELLRLLARQREAAYRDTLNRRERERLRQQLLVQEEATRTREVQQQVLNLRQRNREQAQQVRLQRQTARLQTQQRELERLRYRQQLAGLGGVGMLILGVGSALFWQYRRRQTRREQALRTRLAADLHDDVGNLLTQISMQSSLLRENPNSPTQILARLETLADTSRRAAQQMTDVIWGLNTERLTLRELLTRMRDHAQEVLNPAEIDVQFRVPADLPDRELPVEMRHNLYLIYKEALHNVVKHARATLVTVELTTGPAGLVLTVADNGRGHDGSPRPGGHGLRNMQARAAAVGGTVRYVPQPTGFAVRAEVPG